MPVRKRSKGSWEVYLDIGLDPVTGKRLRHYETVKGSKKLAKQRLAELEVGVESGSYIKPRRITLAEWLNNWLDGYVATNCSPRTAQSYQSEIRRHLIPALGAITLTQLQPHQIQNYYAYALSQGRLDGEGGLSARTVEYHHRILAEALGHAVKMGFLMRNAAEATDPPHPERRNMRTMAIEDIPKYLEATQATPYHVLFYAALYTGMRLGELLGLRWCDVDLDMGCLSVVQALYKRSGICRMTMPKTPSSRRRIALSPSLTLLLREYEAEQRTKSILLGKVPADGDLVFSHPDGKPLDPGVVSHTFAKVLRKAKLPHIRFHDLRHTHATLLLKVGIHPKIVSERLGHASIGITLDTYSHVLPGLQEKAAERFDDLVAGKNGGKMVAGDHDPRSAGR